MLGGNVCSFGDGANQIFPQISNLGENLTQVLITFHHKRDVNVF